jgi:PhoPQ-activated pathogenicity-related protein
MQWRGFYIYVYVRYIKKVVYSLRIDKELREEMEKYNVKWNEEIEKFIREKIEELKKEEVMKELHEVVSSLPETEPVGVRLVREDRDNN